MPFDRDLILVIDDDRDFVQAVVDGLGQDIPDATFLVARDGLSGLKLFESSEPKPAVIILDMMMPKMSGFIVLTKIKKLRAEDSKSVETAPFVIMVTINESSRHKAYGEMLSTFRYLVKPFQMDVLLQAVQDARGKIA